MNTQTSKRAFYTLRILIAFVLMAALLLGLYIFSYRSRLPVAKWESGGSHETFIYKEQIYRCIGRRGGSGLNAKNYPLGKSIGRVEDDGLMEPILGATLESGDHADPSLVRDHAYVLYAVEEKEHILLLLEPDEEYYIYIPEVAVWETGASELSLRYEDHAYFLIGKQGDIGLSKDAFAKGDILGLVRNDHPPVDGSDTESAESQPGENAPTDIELYEHYYIMSTVEKYRNLLMVEDVDGSLLIFCREGSKNPLS